MPSQHVAPRRLSSWITLTVFLGTIPLNGCGDDANPPGISPDAGIPEGPRVEALLDHIPASLVGGESERVTFVVPNDAISLAIVVEGRDDGEYTISDWRDETGFELVRPNWWTIENYECRTCPNTVAWQGGGFAAIAPDNPDSALNPGEHSFLIVGSGINEEVSVSVWVKRATSAPTTGVLDFHFYFTGAYDWNADSAPSTPYFDAVMNRVGEVLARAGIEVGELSFEDLDPGFQNIESTYGPDNDLDALLKQSAGRESSAVNIFFVDELYSGSSAEPRSPAPIIGLSPSPGPPLTHGTINSGVVVSTWSTLSIPESERWPNALAHTIVHETGHHIGLAHTTEFDGVTHDRLDDTPDDDRANLMHADPDPERGDISPWQARILLHSMWVQHPN